MAGRLMTRALVVCGLMGVSVSAAAGAQTPERLNVILISLDTVRPDHLSCYGYVRETTPHIDQVARDGVRFTQAFSQSPNTFPSHLALFTSRYPTKPWVFWEAAELEPATETLTEVLKRHGYRTAAFTNFDRTPFVKPLLSSRPFQAFEQLMGGVQLKALPEELFAWLQEDREQPFFLFLHGFDAHEPHVLPIRYDARRFDRTYQGRVPSTVYELQRARSALLDELRKQDAEGDREVYMKLLGAPHPPEPADLRHAQAVYDAQLYELDQGLAHLFNALKNLDLMERTLLVIVSDHGQAFGEHVQYASHGLLYDEVIRIVLLVRDPRLLPRRDRRESRAESRDGRTVTQLVQAIDLMPTILELLDLPIPASAQGRSLVPLLRTGQDPGREEVTISVGKGMRTIRTPTWKLIHLTDGEAELYHLSVDPKEQRNILTRDPDVAAQLQHRLDVQMPESVVGQPADPDQWKFETSYW